MPSNWIRFVHPPLPPRRGNAAAEYLGLSLPRFSRGRFPRPHPPFIRSFVRCNSFALRSNGFLLTAHPRMRALLRSIFRLNGISTDVACRRFVLPHVARDVSLFLSLSLSSYREKVIGPFAGQNLLTSRIFPRAGIYECDPPLLRGRGATPTQNILPSLIVRRRDAKFSRDHSARSKDLSSR